MPVIGTAGHVDHGKSTLVNALTGIDPDRLAEEKRRGLTIDLGFAWFTTPNGREVGIVDVPGHERFIKNMLAGAGAITVNLFVVAANEGWMPQSQEHLDILHLLGISSAIVVLTKADTVSAEELDVLRETVAGRIAGTTLAGSHILAVSAVTGHGMPELVEAIDRLLEQTPPPPDLGRPRLWIDRVFTIKGSGTVVTGTLGGGSVEVDQAVEVLPGEVRARIRTIQSHRTQWTRLGPGNRTALNLVASDVKALARGHSLGEVGHWRTTDKLMASLSFLPHLDHVPKERGAYKFHVGSVEIDATLRFLQEPAALGEAGLAAIRLARPTVLDFSDRFILRDSGRQQTVGGGTVLEPHPGKFRGDAAVAAARTRVTAGTREQYLVVLLNETGFLAREEVFVRTGVRPEAAVDLAVLAFPSFVVSPEAFERLGSQVLAHVRSYQRAHPLDAGLPLTTLRSALRLDHRFVDELVEEMNRRRMVVSDGGSVRTPEFQPRILAPERDKILAELSAAGASPPTVAQLSESYGADMVRAMVRAGELIQVSQDFVYLRSYVDEVKEQLRSLVAATGPFTVAQFRDRIGTTRKYAVPFLEYLDRTGFTIRQGDLRKLGPKA
ncbi:MAG TPA: selenocysteine-specific translation elongation factor [Actinomycetota bacterium]|nr:selenocysteine-specific translation elongation factor [Actinomycetota bacterium]